MDYVGKFEKVSFEQFREAFMGSIGKGYTKSSGDSFSVEEVRRIWETIELPTRATAGSAGYDFKSPFDFQLPPGGSIRIPTGISVRITDGWWLACVPRSSLGFKYRMQLNNTVGVIDSDYCYSDNEGHIFAKITNDSKDGKDLTIHSGDGFMQGIFLPYGITYDDDVTTTRNGGIGSTGK